MPEQFAQPDTRTPRFRFSTRDLLWFTAAVAIYVFVLLELLRWAETDSAGLNGPSKVTEQFAVAIFVGGALAALVWIGDRQAKIKLGSNQVRWRRPRAWRTAIRLAFVCLLAAVFIAPLPTSVSIYLGMLLGCSTAFFTPIRLGEHGISYQLGTFIPWSQYDLDYDSGNLALTFNDCRRDWSHRLSVPAESREQVERILRANGKLAAN